MNGRIQELSKQAYELQRHKHGGYFTQQLLLDAFAELIVGECIRKIEDIAESSNDPQPIYRVAVELLEHFGVEE